MRSPAVVRATLLVVAVAEFGWSALFYARAPVALALLGRHVIDPVIERQYPLYLASGALAFALAASSPSRYARVAWICIVQRAVEIAAAAIDRRDGAISPSAFFALAAMESTVMAILIVALGSGSAGSEIDRLDRRDRGLARLLRAFGALQLFWFLVSTLFVHLGSSLLVWKLQDLYTTQQQGVALLTIGLTSLLVSTDIARYRVFVWVPIASQLIGVANACNELRLGTISLPAASVQWSIELAIVAAFVWFSRRVLRPADPAVRV